MIKLKDILNKILPKDTLLLAEDKLHRKCHRKANKNSSSDSTYLAEYNDCIAAGRIRTGVGNIAPRTTRRQRSSMPRNNYR